MKIKALIKDIIRSISISVLLAILITSVVIRFRFPELTETELFLKMWWIYIPLGVSMVGVYWGYKSNKL
jgi:hypothetical protein